MNDRINDNLEKPEDITGEMQFGEILRDVGLISSERLQELLEAAKNSDESLGDLLRKEVNVENLKALLRYEIPLPFGKSRKKSLGKTRSSMVFDDSLQEAECVDTSGYVTFPEDELAALLVSEGIAAEANVRHAREQSSVTGIPFWRAILNLKLATCDQMANIIKPRIKQDSTHEKESIIAEVLVNSKLLKPDALENGRQEQRLTGGSLIRILLEKNAISLDQVADAMKKMLDIPYIRLVDWRIDPEMAFVIPEHVVRKNQILPLKISESLLTLGMVDPLNESAIGQVRMITGLDVQSCLIKKEEWNKAVDVLYSGKGNSTQSTELERALSRSSKLAGTEDMSAVQLVGAIIDGALNARATDVHLEPQIPEMRVRYRVDGMLYDVMSIPNNMELPLLSRLKLLSDMNITEKRRPQDGHFSILLKGRELNFRTSSIPTHLGEKMTIRFLDEARVLTGFRQLGLESDEILILEKMIHRPYGLILVTGPIGSGKTTTLYAALNQTNVLNRNIVTIEDPVEYRLSGINQIQVNPSVDLSFESGLRSILRQDADVIMVGEIRDRETARVITWAALTGQLVLGTLHTKSAVNAITMMVNLGVEPYIIGGALSCIVAQRLVRKLCTKCSELIPAPEYFRKQFDLGDDPDLKVGHAVGCPECFQTGFKGRTGVFEIMIIDAEIRELIQQRASDANIAEVAIRNGMRTLRQTGIDKVTSGITTPEEFLREIML